MEKEEIDIGYKRNENKKCDCITTLYACFVIIAVVAIIIMVASIGSLGDTTKVMGLVGILATFVVISNYAQMVDIRDQTNKRIKELEDKLENMNNKVDGMEKTIETDKERIKTKFEGIEKMMYVDQGLFYRYYVIKQQDIYKMVEIKANYVFELSFSLFLSRYDNIDIINRFKEILMDFGVPEDQLKN